MTDEFNQGDKVTPRYTSNFPLTMGKVYVVVKYDPPAPDWRSAWPAYVEVLDDRGKLVAVPARRFMLV